MRLLPHGIWVEGQEAYNMNVTESWNGTVGEEKNESSTLAYLAPQLRGAIQQRQTDR